MLRVYERLLRFLFKLTAADVATLPSNNSKFKKKCLQVFNCGDGEPLGKKNNDLDFQLDFCLETLKYLLGKHVFSALAVIGKNDLFVCASPVTFAKCH